MDVSIDTAEKMMENLASGIDQPLFGDEFWITVDFINASDLFV
jgi:hypothetical protein